MKTIKYKKIEIIQGVEPFGICYTVHDYTFKNLQDAQKYINLIKSK